MILLGPVQTLVNATIYVLRMSLAGNANETLNMIERDCGEYLNWCACEPDAYGCIQVNFCDVNSKL